MQKWIKIKQIGEFYKIQEFLSKIGTEFFKIDEEMTEKNEAEDGNSISFKSPWHMKWDRQQFLPFFTCCMMSQKCKLFFLLYLKEIYAQLVDNMDLDLQITRKHPVLTTSSYDLKKIL